MRSKGLSVALVAVLSFGVLAAPALANKVDSKTGTAVKDVGWVVSGVAKVGKNRDACLDDGTSTVSGPGLGLPLLNPVKSAYYQITAPVFSMGNLGLPGVLMLCGRLAREFSGVAGGIGADCLVMKGWDGSGSISFPGKTPVWLDKVGWKASLFGHFVLTGQAVQAPTAAAAAAKKAGGADVLVGHAIAVPVPAGACASKSGGAGVPKTGGATSFAVDIIYSIANAPPALVEADALP